VTTIGYAVLPVIPSAKDFTSKLGSQIQPGMASEGDKAGRSLGGSMLGGITKAAAVAGGIGTVLFGGSILKSGLDRLVTIQDATTSLTTIMGDATKAGQLLDEIKKTVQGTPFNLDQFAEAGKNLVAMNVPAEKVPGILTAIGEAAAASGKGAAGVDQITTTFGKMASTGKVALDQVWSISEAGVPALQILANHFGVTTEEMQKMISKGAVPAGEAMDALTKGIMEGSDGTAGATKAYAGTMEGLRKTFSGAYGGIKAAGARLGATLLEPFMPLATGGMNGVASFADTLGTKLRPASEAAASGLIELKDAFLTSGESIDGSGTKMEKLGANARKLTDGVQGVWSILAGGEFRGSKMTFGLEEDSKAVDVLFKIRETAIGVYDILFKGDYSNPIWGQLEDSTAVDVLFRIRERSIGIADSFKKLFNDPSSENFASSLSSVSSTASGTMDALGGVTGVATTVSGIFAKVSAAGLDLGATLLNLGADSTVVLTASVKALGSAMGFLADHTGLVGVALGATAVSMVAAQTIETAFHASRVANAIMMPAQLLVQRQLTAALIAHTAALSANTGAQTAQIATTIRGRAAQLLAAGADRVRTAATVQATSALGAYAVAQRAAAASSGVFVGGLRTGAAGVATFAGRVQGVGTAAVSGLRAGMGGLVSMLGGPLSAGLLAAGAAALYLGSQFSSAHKRVEESGRIVSSYAEGLKDSKAALADAFDSSNGIVDDGVTSALTSQIDKFRDAQKGLAESGPGFWGKLGAGFAAGWDIVDGTLDGATLKTTNTADVMSQSGSKISAAFEKLGMSSSELAGVLGGPEDEFRAFTRQLNATGTEGNLLSFHLQGMRTDMLESQSSAGQVGAALQQINDKAIGASGGVDGLSSSLKRLRDDALTAEDAQAKTTLALDRFTKAAAEAGPGAFNAAGQIDQTTVAGAGLHDTMMAVSDAFAQSGAQAYESTFAQTQNADLAAAAAEGSGQRIRDEFVRQQTEILGSSEKAQALADQYRLFPKEIPTQVKLNTEEAATKIGYLQTMINGLSAPVTVAPANPLLGTPISPVLPLPGGANAGGGRLPTSGPGTNKTDGILAVDAAGMPHARVDAGEWIVNKKSSRIYDREIAAINAGTFPKLPGFALGGVALDNAFSLGRRMNGKPYGWGKASFDEADCSGWVAMLQRAVMGEANPQGRLGTTYTLLDGSWPDLLPGTGSPFVVGVNPDHMVARIGNTNFESSDMVKMGGTSASPFDPQFTAQYYLPLDKFGPPLVEGGSQGDGMGLATAPSLASSVDPLELESAQLALERANRSRDETYAKDDADDLDRRDADLSVRQAEKRLVELQAKANEYTGPAPQAPGLVGTMTEDERAIESARLSKESANEQRNKIYADPKSSQIDKAQADLSLRDAEARLTDALTNPSGKEKDGRLMTATELGGELGKVAVAGLLETFGLENSFLADPNKLLGADSGKNVRTTDPLPKQTISDEDAKTQLPFTPDPALGAEQFLPWLKDLRKSTPAALFDQGGVLEDGMLGFNLSKKPESVLTNAETSEWKSGNAAVAEMVRELKFAATQNREGGKREGDTHHWDIKSNNPNEVAMRVMGKLEGRMGTHLGGTRFP